MRRLSPIHSERGSTLLFSIVLAFMVMIVITMIAKQMKQSTKEMVYFENMTKAYRLAESATNKAIGKIAAQADIIDESTFSDWQDDPDGQGKFRHTASKADFDDVSGFYIQAEAVREKGGQEFKTRVHTYARISNVSDYFAAVNHSLGISNPADIEEGKVYGIDLYFGTPVPNESAYVPPSGTPAPSPTGTPELVKTRVKRAEYVNETNWSDPDVQASVTIYDDENPTIVDPVQVKKLLFPQVTEEEIDYFRGLAGSHVKCTFDQTTDQGGTSGVDLFPPGYWPANKGSFVGEDLYGGHTDNNADHVYFCDGSVRVEGTIHGQILIVATGHIFISSTIVSASDTNYPGVGSGDPDQEEMESSAHQLVLITKGDVIVDSSFVSPSNWIPDESVTQKIQALIFAPNSSFYPTPYNSDLHKKMALDFEGAMILGTMDSSVKFPDVYQFSRKYAYMESLKTDPPPYLPVLVDIFHSVEERRAEGVVAP